MIKLTELFSSKTFLMKLLELVISILTIGLVADYVPVAYEPNRLAVVYGTVIGFIMISIITIVASVMEYSLHRTLLLMISLPAGALFLASGAIMIDVYVNYIDVGRLLGSGILALANGIFYLIDFTLTWFRY